MEMTVKLRPNIEKLMDKNKQPKKLDLSTNEARSRFLEKARVALIEAIPELIADGVSEEKLKIDLLRIKKAQSSIYRSNRINRKRLKDEK